MSHSATPLRSPSISTSEYHVLVALTSEIAPGATGVVHGGILDMEIDHAPASLPIVMKLALIPEQTQQLEHEERVYNILKSAGIPIPRIYGLFWDCHGDASALLMSYSGTSIEKSGPTK
ncbi:uncharacterized protein EDB91DRAFT_767624 [Suillus paluster]|uniref:uncharacterized protein n=1 Tax=Suillus paluster TaxID=48578 RepID=UPI001B8676AB|nr:uncharacterized protein EDB91DRAFT_767624 [Suillus paluster]KAG1749836.1 hypothetical protein EDB91DRAFT_767624 [Suillus paluster]